MNRISLDEWYAEYEPVEQDDGDGMLLAEVPSTDRAAIDWYLERRLLWTEMDDDTILPGYHYANRMRYLTTVHPYESKDIIVQNVIEVPERKLNDLYLLLRDHPLDDLENAVIEAVDIIQEWLNL